MWWGVSSCADMVHVTDTFRDQTKKLTLFNVKCINGKIIKNHSDIAGTNNISGNQPNELNKPIKVQFDSRGNLLVLDFNNQRVQNFSLENKNCDIARSILHRLSY